MNKYHNCYWMCDHRVWFPWLESTDCRFQAILKILESSEEFLSSEVILLNIRVRLIEFRKFYSKWHNICWCYFSMKAKCSLKLALLHLSLGLIIPEKSPDLWHCKFGFILNSILIVKIWMQRNISLILLVCPRPCVF